MKERPLQMEYLLSFCIATCLLLTRHGLFLCLIHKVINYFSHSFLAFMCKIRKSEEPSFRCINYLNDERNEVVIIIVDAFYLISCYFDVLTTEAIIKADVVSFDGKIVFLP